MCDSLHNGVWVGLVVFFPLVVLLVLEVEGVRVLARSGDWKLDLMHAYPYVDHIDPQKMDVVHICENSNIYPNMFRCRPLALSP